MSTSNSTFNTSSDFSDNSQEHMAGEVLNGKYVLISELGSGSFSTVWLCYNFSDKKFYALKVQNTDEFIAGEEEVDILKKLSKENCEYINKLIHNFTYKPDFYDDDIDDDIPEEHICMVFELQAGSVYDIIKKGKYKKGLPYKIAIRIIYQLLFSMNIMFKKHKLMHTDIKPDNILIKGISNRTNRIIKEFKKHNIENKYKKEAGIGRKQRKKGKNNNINKEALKKASEFVIKKMEKFKEELSDSEDEEDSDENYEFLDDSLINENIISQLSDFGTCQVLDSECYEIQTRHYMAPEVLLCYPYNESCDIWSVGCTLYEILTGELLFAPEKEKRFNKDRNQLCDIQSYLGKIPDDILSISKKKKVFFKQNGIMKGNPIIEYKSLDDKIRTKLTDRKIDDYNINLVIDFINKIFTYYPNQRKTASDLLRHPIFNILN